MQIIEPFRISFRISTTVDGRLALLREANGCASLWPARFNDFPQSWPGSPMNDTRQPSAARTSDVERLNRVFADVFGADVLPDLPLRLELLRSDAALDESIDALVRDRRDTGASLDDTIDTVSALVQTIAPNDVAPSATDWEDRWREYFGVYDHSVARAIRSYVEYAVQPG